MKIIVIGGGPAGMAAAASAKYAGVEEVLLLERYDYLGGVLPQCIHNGFGTQIYDRDYTGGEYAHLWRGMVDAAGVTVKKGISVLSLEKSGGLWKVSCVSSELGAETLEAEAVIVATGCRERTLPQLGIPGSRPAGVFTAGAAQLMMNRKNFLPGRTAVILGSGDIGLIMARRMTLEGMKVKLILGQESTGLARNIIQCVEDYEIPMKYGFTVVSTHGYQRLKGVTIAPMSRDGKPDFSRKEYIPCDTLLVAAGLIPELEICGEYDPAAEDGLFLCGNVSKVHDLADHVTAEGVKVGVEAAEYLLGETEDLPPEFASLLSGDLNLQEKEKRGNMICTVCPKSCVMKVENNPFSVKGNDCLRGEAFARQELENPQRVLTAVVSAVGGDCPVLSVRTSRPVSKDSIWTVMKAVRKVKAAAPVTVGDTVAENIAGLGVNLIATDDL